MLQCTSSHLDTWWPLFSNSLHSPWSSFLLSSSSLREIIWWLSLPLFPEPSSQEIRAALQLEHTEPKYWYKLRVLLTPTRILLLTQVSFLWQTEHQHHTQAACLQKGPSVVRTILEIYTTVQKKQHSLDTTVASDFAWEGKQKLLSLFRHNLCSVL